LLYVGITRVKAEPASNRQGTLLLTSSRSMTMADAMGAGIASATSSYGNVSLVASRFLRELGPMAPPSQAG
jgi:hypothetical protein